MITPLPAPLLEGEQWCLHEAAFTPKECDHITSALDKLTAHDGTVNGGPGLEVNDKVRDSQVIWVQAESFELTNHLAQLVSNSNAAHFHFDLLGLNEQLQYTRYDEHGHYDWHLDRMPPGFHGVLPRKLSATLLLNDDFEGGQLQFKIGVGEVKMEIEKGSLVVFPSFLLHRVTGVTSGVRKSLVAWFCGPAFK